MGTLRRSPASSFLQMGGGIGAKVEDPPVQIGDQLGRLGDQIGQNTKQGLQQLGSLLLPDLISAPATMQSIKSYLDQVVREISAAPDIERLIYFYNPNAETRDGGPAFQAISRRLNQAAREASSGRVTNWATLLSQDGFDKLAEIKSNKPRRIVAIPKTPSVPAPSLLQTGVEFVQKTGAQAEHVVKQLQLGGLEYAQKIGSQVAPKLIASPAPAQAIKLYLDKVASNISSATGIEGVVDLYDPNAKTRDGGLAFQTISKRLNYEASSSSSNRVTDWTSLLSLEGASKLAELKFSNATSSIPSASSSQPAQSQASASQVRQYLDQQLQAMKVGSSLEHFIDLYDLSAPTKDGGRAFQAISDQLNRAAADSSSGRVTNWTTLLTPEGARKWALIHAKRAISLVHSDVDEVSTFNVKQYLNKVLLSNTTSAGNPIRDIEKLVEYHNINEPSGGVRFQQLSNMLNNEAVAASSGRVTDWRTLLSAEGRSNLARLERGSQTSIDRQRTLQTNQPAPSDQSPNRWIDGTTGFFFGRTLTPTKKENIWIPGVGHIAEFITKNIGLIVVFPESLNIFTASRDKNFPIPGVPGLFKTITTLSLDPKGQQILNVGPGISEQVWDGGVWFMNLRISPQILLTLGKPNSMNYGNPHIVGTVNMGIINGQPCPDGQVASSPWKAGVGAQAQLLYQDGGLYVGTKNGFLPLAVAEAVIATATKVVYAWDKTTCLTKDLVSNFAGLPDKFLNDGTNSKQAEVTAKNALMQKVEEALQGAGYYGRAALALAAAVVGSMVFGGDSPSRAWQ